MQELVFDPAATREYDLMRAGFVWSDELPDIEVDPEAWLVAMAFLWQAVAYRASVSLGEPDPGLEAAWRAVQREFPTWPGFREERRFGQVQRDLRAIRLREARFERECEAADPEVGSKTGGA